MNTGVERRSIIIDTDPGQDDAVAILLALASQELDVVGITAVAGNVPLPLTQNNARKVCELAGRADMKVFAGAERPLVRPLVTAEYVHGKTGLDGPVMSEPNMPLQDAHGVDFIIDTLMNAPEKSITLCPLGPLTNIAMAMVKQPAIIARIREIVLMGGGFFEGGNVTPAAEFNIYVDPHAAKIVLDAGAPVTMLPLDVTHKALATKPRIDAFRNLKTPVGDAVAAMLDFYERFDIEKYGSDGGPLHDPNVIAWLLKPELYKGKHINVEVETGSELTMGMTVADWWQNSARKPNAYYITEVDHEGFFTLLTDRIAKY